MGCNASKPAHVSHTRHKTLTTADISAPLPNGFIQIPLTRFDDEGNPMPRTKQAIDAPTMINALHLMSRFIEQAGRSLIVIAVGGSVSVIYLESRSRTYEVDVFGSHLTHDDRILLDKALNFAIEKSETPLGSEWFNTKPQIYMTPVLHGELTTKAIEQNDIIFRDKGLKVLAAPWEYAFSVKVSRMLNDRAKSYDMEDALAYLDVLLDRNRGLPFRVSMFLRLARHYGTTSSEQFLREEIGHEYEERYIRPAFFRPE